MLPTVIFAEPDSVCKQLKEMRLTLKPLTDSVLAGLMGRAACVPFDPVTSPGTELWRHGSRGLRENLCSDSSDEWRAVDDHNLPLVVNVKTGIAITVSSGNFMTGVPDENIQPTTKQPKGPMFSGIVRRNLQHPLFGEKPKTFATPKRDQRIVWILLVYVNGNIAHSELSLPQASENGKVVSWRQRIILPTVTLDLSPEPRRRKSDSESVEIDVPVVRKSGS